MNVFFCFSILSLKFDVLFFCVLRSGRFMRRCCRYIEVFLLYYWYRFFSNGIGWCEEVLLFMVILEFLVYIVGGRVFIRIFGLLGVDGR